MSGIVNAGRKIAEREFAWPMSGSALALANDAASMGLSDTTVIIVVGASLVYAGLRIWQKVQEAKIALHKKDSSTPES